MTPVELAALLDGIVLQLGDIVSFLLGGISGLAFVITANSRWF